MTKIKAEILPNNRKYYGTEIQLTNEEGQIATFNVWVNAIGDYKPSEREIDFEEDGKFYVIDPELQESFEYEVCDDHYETAAAYKISKAIVAALDGLEV